MNGLAIELPGRRVWNLLCLHGGQHPESADGLTHIMHPHHMRAILDCQHRRRHARCKALFDTEPRLMRAGNAPLQLGELAGGEAHGVGHGLAMDEAGLGLVALGHRAGIAGCDLDEIAEHAVVADLQGRDAVAAGADGDPRVLPWLRARAGDRAQAGADRAAAQGNPLPPAE